MQLENFYRTCGDVKKALTPLLGSFGNNKKIVVPKTIIAGGLNRYVLYTGLEHERYSSEHLTRFLGLMGGVVTHEGINTMGLTGRVNGECSIILPSEILKRFEAIIMTDQLFKDMNRESSIVAYSCGNKVFYCGVGKYFLQEFSKIHVITNFSEIQ